MTWQGNNVMGSQQFVCIFSGNGRLSGKGRVEINKTNFINNVIKNLVLKKFGKI
jgi:hypothetical protein